MTLRTNSTDLRCLTCRSSMTRSPAGTSLICPSCPRVYEIQNGIVHTGEKPTGENLVVANFYDGKKWLRMQHLESLFFLFQGGLRRARQQVTKHLPPLEGTRLLFGGVGEGNDLEFLSPETEIYGMDISIEQLTRCAQRHPNRDVMLILGECEHPPFGDQFFDNFLSMGCFNFFTDKVGCLREVVRTTKTGGKIIISDEVPKLGARGQNRRIGRRILDRMVGADFAAIVRKESTLVIEDVAKQVLSDFTIHSIWGGKGYCLDATVRDADREKLMATA